MPCAKCFIYRNCVICSLLKSVLFKQIKQFRDIKLLTWDHIANTQIQNQVCLIPRQQQKHHTNIWNHGPDVLQKSLQSSNDSYMSWMDF